MISVHGSVRQSFEQFLRLPKMCGGLPIGRSLHGALSRHLQIPDGLVQQPCLAEVPTQQLRLVLSDFCELGSESFRNASVHHSSGLAQQGAVSGVLYKGMFEQISGVRGHTLPEEQACRHEPVKRRLQFRFRLARHRSQQSMRELSPNHRSDLRHVLSGTEPIKSCH